MLILVFKMQMERLHLMSFAKSRRIRKLVFKRTKNPSS